MCHQERLCIGMIGKDHRETNPITVKPETASHVAEQFSWVPLPYCSPPGCPFPIKSLALSAHVSPRTILFQVLDKSPVLGPGRGPLSCNKLITPSFTIKHHYFPQVETHCFEGMSPLFPLPGKAIKLSLSSSPKNSVSEV